MDTLFARRAGKVFTTGEDFEPLQNLCRMAVLTLRRLDLTLQSKSPKTAYYGLIDDILDYPGHMEIAEQKVPFPESMRLEELLERSKDIQADLNINRDGVLQPLAIRGDLCLFVKQRAERGSIQPVCTHPDRPLLSFALPVFRLRSAMPAKFHYDMVKVLLESGSDPNTMTWLWDEEKKVERRGTVYALYLRTIYSLHKRPKMLPQGSQALLTTEALVEAGAQYVPNCLTEDGNKGEKEVLEIAFGKTEAARLLNLRAHSSQPDKSQRTGSGTSTRPAWAKAGSKLRRLSLSVSAVDS